MSVDANDKAAAADEGEQEQGEFTFIKGMPLLASEIDNFVKSMEDAAVDFHSTMLVQEVQEPHSETEDECQQRVDRYEKDMRSVLQRHTKSLHKRLEDAYRREKYALFHQDLKEIEARMRAAKAADQAKLDLALQFSSNMVQAKDAFDSNSKKRKHEVAEAEVKAAADAKPPANDTAESKEGSDDTPPHKILAKAFPELVNVVQDLVLQLGTCACENFAAHGDEVSPFEDPEPAEVIKKKHIEDFDFMRRRLSLIVKAFPNVMQDAYRKDVEGEPPKKMPKPSEEWRIPDCDYPSDKE